MANVATRGGALAFGRDKPLGLHLNHFGVAPDRMARTKIVATVGPACNSPETLLKLVKTGVDVFRINMAHGSRAVHQQIVEDVRLVSEQAGRPLAILVDLAGPKIRLGQLPEDPIQCEVGSIFHFVRGDQSNALDELTCTYETLCDELDVCNIVMLADGAVAMEVVEKHPDRVSCLVICGGEIRSRQGVNLPGVDLKTPSLTAEDRSNTHWAVEAGVDFLGLSFVRRPEDILELKELLEGAESPPAIIAKIEKREALDNLEAIAVVSHGVMVARGDLGVEIDVAETPLAQKRIIEVCRKHQPTSR